ncbi:AAA family ATPase [Candidatus Microgenomates bacterium]|nr:MAG: AAA family ATPase [Candidatus Microgenomates bacterium]
MCGHGYPVLITGAPGIGKSDIVYQVASGVKSELLISHPVVDDPTDPKGYPWPDKDGKSAKHLPYGILAQALKATKKTIWFLDDLGQATPAVQASYMQLLLARRVGEHVLPDCVTFIAATNRRTDRAGVQGILEPVKSRFVSIVELSPTIDDWVHWAIGKNISPELIGFLRMRPDLLSDFHPSSDMSNSPCPRTWAHVAKILTADPAEDILFPMIAGAVGMGAAVEFISFLKTYREMVDPEEVFKNPKKAPIPDKAIVKYALVAALAHRADKHNFPALAIYAQRLHSSNDGEFAVLLLRDSVRRNQKIGNTKAFVDLITSTKLGSIINDSVSS